MQKGPIERVGEGLRHASVVHTPVVARHRADGLMGATGRSDDNNIRHGMQPR